MKGVIKKFSWCETGVILPKILAINRKNKNIDKYLNKYILKVIFFTNSILARKEEKYSLAKQLGLLTMIPIVLAVGPILGWFIGNFLDEKLGTSPYLMYLFIVFGFVAAGKEVYNLVKKASLNNNKKIK